jgi:hypothetical protein
MNPPQGSAPIKPKSDTYERRDGQWVRKLFEEGARRSVNEALKSPAPQPQNGCKHKWGPNRLPVPLVACRPPLYYYQCTLCDKQTSTHVNIPIACITKAEAQCKHEFVSDSSLGADYEKYQACTKCGGQQVK